MARHRHRRAARRRRLVRAVRPQQLLPAALDQARHGARQHLHVLPDVGLGLLVALAGLAQRPNDQQLTDLVRQAQQVFELGHHLADEHLNALSVGGGIAGGGGVARARRAGDDEAADVAQHVGDMACLAIFFFLLLAFLWQTKSMTPNAKLTHQVCLARRVFIAGIHLDSMYISLL